MKNKEITIGRYQNRYDNAFAELVNAACAYKSEIHLNYENKQVNAKSIMGILAFSAGAGAKVVITAEGPDEDVALAGMEDFLTQ